MSVQNGHGQGGGPGNGNGNGPANPPPGQACYRQGTRIAVPLSEIIRIGDVRQIERLNTPVTKLLGLGLPFITGKDHT